MEKLNMLMDMYFVGEREITIETLDVLRILANDNDCNPLCYADLVHEMHNVEIIGYVGCEYEIISRYLRDEGIDNTTALSMVEYMVDILNKDQRITLVLDWICDDIQVFDNRLYYRIY